MAGRSPLLVTVTPKGRRVLVRTWRGRCHQGVTFVEVPDRAGSVMYSPAESASEVWASIDLYLRRFDQVLDDPHSEPQGAA